MNCERCKNTGTLFNMMLVEVPCDVCGGWVTLSREQKERYILEGYDYFGIGHIDDIKSLSDERIEEEADWIEYLWTK